MVASELLFQFSGRQFNGRCTQTRRPCADGCSWPSWLFPGLSPGAPQYPVGYDGWGWWGTGWGWGAAGCNSCGCTPLSSALLAGYPVVSIEEVEIDGVVLASDQYRLDEWRWLTRMADPTTGEAQRWPSCQRLDRPDGEDSTWSVTYVYGITPPLSGQKAAAQLGGEIYKSCLGGDCALPTGTVQRTRAGITIQKAPFISWGQINGRWATGLPLVDAFLTSVNKRGLTRRPIAWAPGRGARYARRVGV